MDRRTRSVAALLLKGPGTILLALFVLILILGLIPVETSGLTSSPTPAASYAEALDRFETIRREEAGIVNDAGGSLLLTHGDVTDEAFVLIHGTTNSPRQWEELGNTLHMRGHNVLIPRMPHHGLESHDISELAALRVEELVDYADEVVDIAQGLGRKVTVVGLSGGGAVTTWIGQYRSDVDRILALVPFFGVPEVPAVLNTFLMNLASRAPNVNLQNPAEPRRDWVYRGEATRGVAEFMKLGRSVFSGAERQAPAVESILLVTTAVDDTADNDYTVELARLWEEAGANVDTFEFVAALDIPHNSVDPASDPEQRMLVYNQMLVMLGEEPVE